MPSHLSSPGAFMRITRRLTKDLFDFGRLPNEEDMAKGFDPFEAVSCAKD